MISRRNRFGPALARTVGVCACLTLIACDDTTGVNYTRRPGQLRYFDLRDNVTVPDTVDRGVPFNVKITTYGDGCAQLGDTPVSMTAQVITVAPHDIFAGGRNVACPDVLRSLEHIASISVSTPGAVTIRIRGRDYPVDSTFVIERRLVVR